MKQLTILLALIALTSCMEQTPHAQFSETDIRDDNMCFVIMNGVSGKKYRDTIPRSIAQKIKIKNGDVYYSSKATSGGYNTNIIASNIEIFTIDCD